MGNPPTTQGLKANKNKGDPKQGFSKEHMIFNVVFGDSYSKGLRHETEKQTWYYGNVA